MGALRKAGVWLGLVEEDDERAYDAVFDDEFADDEDDAPPPRPRSLSRPTSRSTARESRPEPRTGESRLSESRLSDSRGVDGRAQSRLADVRAADRAADRARAAELRASEREARAEELRSAELRSAEARAAETRAAEIRAAEARAEARAAEARAAEVRAAEVRAEARAAEREPRSSSRLDDTSRGVRHLSRPTSTSSTTSYPTQDNLALAPQVRLRERGVVGDDQGRRHQITTLHPTTYSEARAIGEHFRDGHPVIMNLTEMDEPDAKRLVDFAAGLAFGLRGSFERVTNRVFLLSPANIQVTAEDKARIAEGGFFDQG
jgi:cell division inhibitor SepF